MDSFIKCLITVIVFLGLYYPLTWIEKNFPGISIVFGMMYFGNIFIDLLFDIYKSIKNK